MGSGDPYTVSSCSCNNNSAVPPIHSHGHINLNHNFDPRIHCNHQFGYHILFVVGPGSRTATTTTVMGFLFLLLWGCKVVELRICLLQVNICIQQNLCTWGPVMSQLRWECWHRTAWFCYQAWPGWVLCRWPHTCSWRPSTPKRWSSSVGSTVDRITTMNIMHRTIEALFWDPEISEPTK